MASTELDLSLDEIIKQRKASRGGARGGRGTRGSSYGGRGAGPLRRTNNRTAVRATPYIVKPAAAAADGPWQHDLFTNGAAASGTAVTGGIETGTKLYVSNLEFGVSNEDIKELFGEIGDLKRASVHYDRSGRSKGTAEVVFARKADALTAMQRYNNVQLDGKPMKIEIIGTTVGAVSTRLGPGPVATVPMKQRGATRPGIRGRGSFAGARGARGGGRGRGRGRRNQQPTKSKEELDAELDSYQEAKPKAEPMES